MFVCCLLWCLCLSGCVNVFECICYTLSLECLCLRCVVDVCVWRVLVLLVVFVALCLYAWCLFACVRVCV